MKKLFIVTFFAIFSMIPNNSNDYRCIKILDIQEIKYYYVYKAFEIEKKDTLTFISSKSDIEFRMIMLEKDSIYKIKTRIKSTIKISDSTYVFCKHGKTIIENVQISDKNKLPIMIIDFNKINNYCCNVLD
jgi:hypothetical protein